MAAQPSQAPLGEVIADGGCGLYGGCSHSILAKGGEGGDSWHVQLPLVSH